MFAVDSVKTLKNTGRKKKQNIKLFVYILEELYNFQKERLKTLNVAWKLDVFKAVINSFCLFKVAFINIIDKYK